MLVLLPPSETKRDGGTSGALDLAALAWPALTPTREAVLTDLVTLAADRDGMMRALKLGPRLSAEVDRNAAVRDSPTMPALDRYTGVLYDALDAGSLDRAAREFAASAVAVHSAAFGLVGGLDPIPAYRLSHDSRLPGARLKARWRTAVARELEAHDGLIVDLRSEGYVELGPAPRRADSVFVRVVADDGSGRRRALNHFNKQAKGRFTRTLLETRPTLATTGDLVDWAASAGFVIYAGSGDLPEHEVQLVA